MKRGDVTPTISVFTSAQTLINVDRSFCSSIELANQKMNTDGKPINIIDKNDNALLRKIVVLRFDDFV